MHVVHIISGLPLGGAQTALKQLVARMNKDLFRHTVISLSTKGMVGSQIEALEVPVIEIGIPRGVPSVTCFTRLARELRQIQPNLVQTWMYHADLLGLLAVRYLGLAPIVWNIRGTRLSIGWREPFPSAKQTHPSSLRMDLLVSLQISSDPEEIGNYEIGGCDRLGGSSVFS